MTEQSDSNDREAETPQPPTYGVGYGRPPLATRFQPGQSGNPKGRPKVRRAPAQVLDDELHAMVTITENGKRRRMSRLQVLARNAINGSIRNQPGAARLLDFLLRRFPPPSLAIPAASLDALSEEDAAEVADLFNQLTSGRPTAGNQP